MKKFFVALLALCMVVSMVGCSSGGDKTTETGSKETTTADAPKATSDTAEKSASGDNKLTVWCWDPAFNIYAMNEAAKVYKETNPDFELEVIETPWADVQTKLTTAGTSGQLDTLPDILLMQDNAFQKNYANYPDVFTDLTASGIDFSKFAAAKVAYSVADGKNFGVPFDNGAAVMALRTDILEQAGLTIADFTDITWDKFIELGESVLAKTGLPMMSSTAGEPDFVMEALQSCGQSLFNPDGTTNIVGNAALVEAMSIYTDMVKKGIIVEVNGWDQYIGTLSNGSVVGTVNGCWILGSIQATPDQSGKWALTNIPSLNDIPNATNYSNNGGSSWVVTANCKNVELAADFFAKTYAGSVPFYETILPSAGALATYLPAGDSDVYSQPSEFFGGQKVFVDITTFAGKVPSNTTGVYYYEARDAIGVAMTNVVAGSDLETEIQAADDAVKFQMGE